MRVGVLALQGAVQEHERALARCGASASQVRLPSDLAGLDGLIFPGGESTVMALYLREYGLDVAIRARVASGLALFGLCAGAIILCEEVDGAPGPLGLLPARATRNFYGRQLASFEDDIETDLGPFHGIFIRAPRLEALGETRVIGRRRAGGSNGSVGEAVLLRRGRILAGSFHPELSGDDRIHEFFLGMVAGRG